MRRSTSSSCSSSSSSESGKPKAKRVRTNARQMPDKCPDKCQNADQTAARRSSVFRGVTRHRWTGRFEAHLWDKSTWNNVQNKKGRQVYLGAYDSEEAAARTYDLAALKYWGPTTILNFPIDAYKKDLEEMEGMSKEEYLASLRRHSSGFSRGVSKYRGVARHHHNGRWEARIGRVYGNKYLYLGTYNTQEEAAAAYDMAAIEYRGANAVTNFDISNYIGRVKMGTTPPDPPQPPPHPNRFNKTVESQHQQKQEESAPPSPPAPPPLPPQVAVQQLPPQEFQCCYTTLHPSSCMDSSSSGAIAAMDSDEHEQALPWCLGLDIEFMPPVPVPLSDVIPFYKTGELLDLFDGRGFEDNIDFLFDQGGDASNSSTTATSVSCDSSV